MSESASTAPTSLTSDQQASSAKATPGSDSAFIAEHGRLLRSPDHKAFDPFRRAVIKVPAAVSIAQLVLAILLIPFRIGVAVFFTSVTYAIVKIFGPPVTPESTAAFEAVILPPWRRRIVIFANKLLGRFLLLALGFWVVEGEDDPKYKQEEAVAATIISNHSSLADPCLMAYLFAPAFVAKSNVYNIPGVGRVGGAQHAFYIDRMHSSRVSIAEKIADRQRAVLEAKGGLPPVAIYPEGTTTNGRHLLAFRTGAFIAGTPVSPILIKYSYKVFSPSLDSIRTGKYIYGLLTQFANHVKYYRMPVYYPSEEEQADAALYASNVRKIILAKYKELFGEELIPSDSNLVDKMEYHNIVRGDKLKPGLKLNKDP